MRAPDALTVLAEPHRRAIVGLLRDGERCVGDLVGSLEMSQPGVSKHLRVLRDAGVVEARVEAQRRLYSIRPSSLVELDEWLAGFRSLWEGRLDDLDESLEKGRR